MISSISSFPENRIGVALDLVAPTGVAMLAALAM
jgi:hypothetical protein